ncbi:MAG: hypothetical protein JXQ23_09880 [Clostridia bacterium]|nr:hypothetical protein [Clostridia bacterium]
MKKKLLLAGLVLVLLLSYSTSLYAFSSTGLYPEVMVDRDMSVPTLIGGKDNTLLFSIRNYTKYDAKNVKVTLDFMGLSQYVTINELNGTKVIGDILEFSKEDISYDFYLSETVPSGVYLIKLTYDLKDELNDGNTTSEEIYVNVKNSLAPSSIYISNIKATPEKVIAGDKFKIGVEITNAGDVYAKNIKIDMNNFEDYKFAPVNATDIAYINRLDGKQSVWVYYDVTALDNIESALCDLMFAITYENPDSQQLSFSNPAYLKIETGKAAEQINYVPKIIIDSYSTSQEIIMAGTEFDLVIKFQNTSKTETVNNIKASLDFGADGVFIPVESSNTFYIDEIQPEGTVEKTIKLYAKTGAATQFYSINVNMNYERGKSSSTTQLQESESITVSVKQIARIQVNELYMPTEIPVNNPFGIYFSFYNLGKGTLYNLSIKIEGDGIDGTNSVYFAGNLSAGGNNYYDGSFMPMITGELNGNIVFEFEDEMGNKDSIKQPIKFMAVDYNGDGGILDPWVPEFPPVDEGVVEPQNSLLTYGIIGIGLVLVTVITIVVIKKRKNKEVE